MADYSTASPFIDKDADQADLERKNKIDLATIGAVSKAMTGSAGAAAPTSSSPFGGAQPSAPASGPTPQQMGVNAVPAASQAPQNAFDSFSAFLRETDPSLQALKTRAAAGVQSQFDNPAAGFDQGAAIAREDLAGGIHRAREATREDLIKTYGANASQVMPQLQNFDQEALLQSRDLNRRLTADRSTAAATGLNQAISNAMGMTGQASQERLNIAGLAEQSRQSDENRSMQKAEAALGRQFTTSERQAIQAWQTAERAGAQDFASAEAKLGRKFTTEERQAIQAFQSSEREASQEYQSGEAELGRKFTTQERLGIQDFQRAERLGAQDFASAEALLGRKFTTEEREAIQAYQTSERLSTQDFTRIMTERGWVETRDLDTIRRNHEKELLATNISADQAKQISEQAHQVRLQEREEQFQTTQADLTRKWTTGERVETQAWQTGIQANEFRQQEAISKLEILARESLAKGGWDNESKLQAERLLAEAADAEKARSSQYLMFSAQMAQEDRQFAKEFGLEQEAMLMKKEAFREELKGLKLGNISLQTAMGNAKVDRALEMAVYGLELWNGENEEALTPFVTAMATALGEGLDLDPVLLQQAIKSSFQATTPGLTGGTAAALEKAQGMVDTMAPKFPAKVNPDQVKTALQKVSAAQDYGNSELVTMAGLPGFGANVAPEVTMAGKKFGGTATPAAKDYMGFHSLVKMGVPEADAAKLITEALGADRFKAAYKAMNGKDWGGA